MSVPSINGRTLTELGIGMTACYGWDDGVSKRRDAVQLSGPWGQIEGAIDEAAPRIVTIEGRIRDNTVATRHAVLQRALAAMQGRVELVFPDKPGRFVLGRLEEGPVEPIHPMLAFERDVINLRLRFKCANPYYRDANATVVSFDSTARAVPMGTGPHQGIIRIGGTPTNPTVTVRDFRGAVVATLGLTGTLAADEAWIIDLYEHRIWLSDSGVQTRDDSKLTSGYFWDFEPGWADHYDSSWPTIEIDQGTADLTYYRGYET